MLIPRYSIACSLNAGNVPSVDYMFMNIAPEGTTRARTRKLQRSVHGTGQFGVCRSVWGRGCGRGVSHTRHRYVTRGSMHRSAYPSYLLCVYLFLAPSFSLSTLQSPAPSLPSSALFFIFFSFSLASFRSFFNLSLLSILYLNI
jgi:hypothetical protein